MRVLGRTKPLKNVTSLPCFWKTGSEKASDWSDPRRCLQDDQSNKATKTLILSGEYWILNIDQLSVIWRSCWSEEMFPRSPREFSSDWDWALSSHRGPECPPCPPYHQSLHSLLWWPSSSQLKALNSYYWHTDNMQIFEEDKQKNKCSSSKSYAGPHKTKQTVLQMSTSVVSLASFSIQRRN